MNTISRKKVVNLNRIIVVTITITIGFAVLPGIVPKAYSGKGAAFLGGMVAGHLVTGAVERSERRTRAAEYQAYSQPPAIQQAAPVSAPAARPTVQQRLDQLDKLAAGGYITPQEYKAKKKAILDGM